MCRLFGFRSIISSLVHSSLVEAENALVNQSLKHPDGWGLAYFIEDTPHLIKSPVSAIDDHLFEKVSGVVSSQTVVAHIRNATQGKHDVLNTHPFQFGPWVFAHNGNIKNFEHLKDKLARKIDKDLKRFILGTTDSEIIFFVILSFFKKHFTLSKKNILFDEIKHPIAQALNFIVECIGPLFDSEQTVPTENYLSFILTNGPLFIGFNGGQRLRYCTHKTRCPERDTCSHFSKICEMPSKQNNQINHLIFASEKIKGVNVWNDLLPGELIGTDHSMILKKQLLELEFTKNLSN